MEKRVSKVMFVVVGAWLLGGFGVDRFMRGQTGLGVAKIFLGWAGWALVDFIIALTKLGKYGEEFVFVDGQWGPPTK